MPMWKDKWSFTSGAVRRRDLAYFVATNDKLAKDQEPYTLLLTWHAGKWYHIELKYSAPSVCVPRLPIEQGLAVGELGDAFATGQKDDHPETITDGALTPQKRGPLTTVRSVEGKAYAVGMGRQVYIREGRDSWKCMDDSCRASDDEGAVGFKDIDGYSGRDLYAVGFKGEIWHYDGKKWSRIDSPTNLILNDVCCAPDGTVYISGYKGMLLRGDSQKFEVLDHDKGKENFWGLAWYGDRLHVSSLKRVMTLEKDDELKPVDMDEPVTSAYHLSAADGVLWSIGPKDIMAFDGKAWTRIE